jgi:GNAT superfamily N-acetyltransferase
MPSKRVVVDRPAHTIALEGENILRADITIESSRYGDPSISRGSYTEPLGEMQLPAPVNWSVKYVVENPHDDVFPRSMNHTIANLGMRGMEQDESHARRPEEVALMDMYHLHVQPEARGDGYGGMLWDVYAAALAWGDYHAIGGVGGGQETAAFLQRKGVPQNHLQYDMTTPANDEGIVRWGTPAENIVSGMPIEIR